MSTAREVITEVMGAVRAVGKDEVNAHQGFKFRGIDAVVNAIGPALREAGGFIVPTVTHSTHEVAQSAKGGVLNTVRLQVDYAVYGQEGDPVTGSVSAEAFDSGDKATAKCMSVAYRTFMLQLFCLPTGEPDPDASTYKLGSEDIVAGNQKTRDYMAEAKLLKDIDQVRLLWGEASKAGAPDKVLNELKTYAEKLAPAGKRDGTSAGVSGSAA
jgi:hypothetical protein